MIRDDHKTVVDRLIPLIDVKRTLAVSWPYLMNLIHLRAS